MTLGAKEGPALLQRLHDCHVPFVLITSRNSVEFDRPCAHVRLSKPFTEEDLVHSLLEAMGNSSPATAERVVTSARF